MSERAEIAGSESPSRGAMRWLLPAGLLATVLGATLGAMPSGLPTSTIASALAQSAGCPSFVPGNDQGPNMRGVGSKGVGVAFGDVDGDGNVDAVVAHVADCPTCRGGNEVWLGDGAGRFSDSGQRLGVANSWDVTLGDVDGDGDLDAVAANGGYDTNLATFVRLFAPERSLGAANQVWLNDGAGTFTAGAGFGDQDSRGLRLGDLDGDGDLDAFVANNRHVDLPGQGEGAGDRVWLGDGTGGFTDSGQRLGSRRGNAVAMGDVDGDGDLDAFVANTGYNKVYHNRGDGTFEDRGQTVGVWIPWGPGGLDKLFPNTRDVAMGDLDGDGDLDAFTVNAGIQDVERRNHVLLNDGRGTFVDSGIVFPLKYSFAVAVGDMDGDGDIDAVVGHSSFCGDGNTLWRNDGVGADGALTFTNSGQELGRGNTWGAALADADGDGDLDAWLANYGGAPDAYCRYVEGDEPDEMWLNDGGGRLADNGQPDLGAPPRAPAPLSRAVALADLDRDGDEDAVVVSAPDFTSPHRARVLRNDGGAFVDTGIRLGSNDVRGVALGDVNSDGYADVFVVERVSLRQGSPDRVYLNQGARNGLGFDDSGQRLGGKRGNTATLGDLDGDGDLDAFVANTELNLVWRNDGAGGFSAVAQPDDVPGRLGLGYEHPSGLAPNSEDVALGDLDGDGDLDAFVANAEAETGFTGNTVWLNDGTGRFGYRSQPGEQPGRMGLAQRYSFAVALSDFDLDGDLDAVTANGDLAGAPDVIWTNRGNGQFDEAARFGDDNSTGVDLADFDCDGGLDLVMSGVRHLRPRPADATCPVQRGAAIWLVTRGAGGGFNVTDSGVRLGAADSQDVALGDLNGDGPLAPDVYLATEGMCAAPDEVWLNECPCVPTPTPEPTATNTPVTPTATNTPITPTATDTPEQATATNTPVTPTATDTPEQPTATNTPITPTATDTPEQATATNTPITPTATDTPEQATATNTPITPTATDTPEQATATNTPITPTATDTPEQATATNTPITPTATDTPEQATATNTPTTPTATDTPEQATATATNTPNTPTATNTPEKATSTPTPVPGVAPCVCRIIYQPWKVTDAERPPILATAAAQVAQVIVDHTSDPPGYFGLNDLLNPNVPGSPHFPTPGFDEPPNPRRACLDLTNRNLRYHPLFNRPIWRAGCLIGPWNPRDYPGASRARDGIGTPVPTPTP